VEEEGQDALEMAQKAHEKEKARPKDEKEVSLLSGISPMRGYGVTWYPYGLQLWA